MPRSTVLTCAIVTGSVAFAAPAPATAQTGRSPGVKEASKSAKAKVAPRRGGTVRRAWPLRGKAPRRAAVRWLARQVGGKRVSRRARAAQAAGTLQFSDPSQPLRLVRSYAIPSIDPSATRLANLSWTYDSAMTAIALLEAGERALAEQLLDQLAALQRTDGSIDFAFNTLTGSSVPLFRTGTVSTVGLAALMHRDRYRSSRYDAMATRAATWLFTRAAESIKRGTILLAGGPDVTWRSTQHNLLSVAFLRHYAELVGGTYGNGAELLAEKLDEAIESGLLVSAPSGTYFKQGVDDDVRPLDVQALGILWLLSNGEKTKAAAVRAYVAANFAVTGRSIVQSTLPDAYNTSWSATTTFTGYRPYASATTPDVLWREGTAMMRYALRESSIDTTALDASMAKWDAVSAPSGPLQADRTVTGSDVNEYHVWPSASAAAWSLATFKNLPDLFD